MSSALKTLPRLALLALVAAFTAAIPAAAATPAEDSRAAAAGGAAPMAHGARTAKAARRARSTRDIDGDGIENRRDRDMDGDRVPNRRDRDVDGDRVRNARDRDIDADGAANRRDREMDSDRVRNARDRDIDGDRLRNCPRDTDMDADRVRNARDRDMDGDGTPNGRDRDMDADGRRNDRDSDMDCDRVPNRFDPDMDGDGIPNYKDPDSDADGISEDGQLPSGVRLPKSFFGLVAGHAYASEGARRMAEFSQIGGTGVGTLRQTFEWSHIETLPGVWNFSAYDSFVGDAARQGFTVLPVLFDPPAFRSSRPLTGAARGTYPPKSNPEFGAFAARLVRRYGPSGTFWAQHPSVPRRPIRSWQVWNEPHVKAYWPAGPNPAAYTAMLKTVSGAIKSADPGAEVIAAAISESALGMPLEQYFQGMYDSGARGSFDTLAVHPYAAAADQVYEIMLKTRQIADRNGDSATPLRVTEVGWSTGGPASPFRIDATGQAELVKRVWAALVKERDILKLRGLIYYGWRDLEPYAPLFQDFFGLHTGLVERDGRPKPSAASFTQAVRAMSAR